MTGPSPHLVHWYAALRSPLGIMLRVNNPRSATGALYRARERACDLALHSISILTHPDDPNILILGKLAEDDPTPRGPLDRFADLDVEIPEE